jgi:uncharacterized LabA/DUF88 family protein
MTDDKRIALLIDADNVSEKYLPGIITEVSKFGTPTYKRIYGDWTKPQVAPWKSALLSYSITPIQQYGYTTGKNATDSAMIIDAMDILYTGNVDGFCIVSSDSDFTRLASRLRESGKFVLGMGEKKTPNPFKVSCEVFRYLEVLGTPETGGETDALSTEPSLTEQNQGGSKQLDMVVTGLSEVIAAIQQIVEATSNDEGWTYLSTVGNMLNKKYPDFDPRNYGFIKLRQLVAKSNCFHEKTFHSENGVSNYMIKNKETEKVKPGKAKSEKTKAARTNPAHRRQKGK